LRRELGFEMKSVGEGRTGDERRPDRDGWRTAF